MKTSSCRRFLPKIGKVRCRHCGSENVRLSRIGADNSFLSVFRCKDCNRHFKAGPNLRLFVAYLFGVMMLLVILAMLAIVLYYSFSDNGILHTAIFSGWLNPQP